MALRTNYKDDVFSGNRKYTQINNGDGTISFTDQTNYSQVGDSFGATQINEIDGKINSHDTSINSINSYIDNTMIPNITTLNNQLTCNTTSFYFDWKNGKWGWNSSPSRGADTFHPFSQIQQIYLDRIVTSGLDRNAEQAADVHISISEVNRLQVNRYWTNSQEYGNQPAYIDLSPDGTNWARIWTNPQTAATLDIGTFDVTNYIWARFHVESFGAGVSSGFWWITGYNVV